MRSRLAATIVAANFSFGIPYAAGRPSAARDDRVSCIQVTLYTTDFVDYTHRFKSQINRTCPGDKLQSYKIVIQKIYNDAKRNTFA